MPTMYQMARSARTRIVQYLAIAARAVRLTLPTSIHGERVFLRVGTVDKCVADSCLGGEFANLRNILPQLRFGLIIDAGGYIGTAAIAFSRLFPDAKVVTIEPSIANFRLLQRNVRNFPNITALQKALVGTNRLVSLHDRGTGEWGYSILEELSGRPDAKALHRIDTVTLPDLMDTFGVRGIDVLKLDIEGAEKELFESSEFWLPRTTVVVAELHDRIAPGCTDAFIRATSGMAVSKMGEKMLAVSCRI